MHVSALIVANTRSAMPKLVDININIINTGNNLYDRKSMNE